MARDQIQLDFNKANVKRNQISDLPKSFQESLSFMDYRIRKQLKSFTLLSICGGNRQNFMVDSNYQRAFNTLTLQEKVKYYHNIIKITINVIKILKSDAQLKLELPKVQLTLLLFQSKNKSEALLLIDEFKVLSKSRVNFNLDLRNYLLRKSKKKDQKCYVLQAINNSDPQTVRFAFITNENQQKYLPLILSRLESANFLYTYKLMEQIEQRKKLLDIQNKNNPFRMKIMKEKDNVVQKTSKSYIDIPQTQSKQQSFELGNESRCRSICEDLVKNVEDQRLVDELDEFIDKQQKNKRVLPQSDKQKLSIEYQKNIFRIMLSSYPLEQITSLMHFGSVYFSDIASLFIYRHIKNHNIYKLQMNVKLSVDLVCKIIYNVHLFKYWHPQIEEGQIKLNISSQNSCILYQKHKAFNQWYRNRDFLTLTHLFKLDQSYYIAQKSIQHSYFIPFQSLIRGNVEYLVWKIEALQQNECSIFAQIKIDHQGMINKAHQQELTIRFLKGFQLMEAYYMKIQNMAKLNANMSLKWEISEHSDNKNAKKVNRHRNLSLQTVDFDDSVQQISGQEEDQIFYSCEDISEDQDIKLIQEQQQKSEHEVEAILQPKLQSPHQLQLASKSTVPAIKFDAQGLVVLPQDYIKHRFMMVPNDNFTIQKCQFPNNNIVLKNHWQLKKTGALKLINKSKLDAQNNVFSFILKTMKKNLLSGKGLLNISLPVQIFNGDSNLQRCCQSMTLGPHFLQKAAKQTNPIQRLKLCTIFGFSNSIIYFDVQKPFNPILGETFQGYVRGCPVYGQQISHHPPISSIYLVGRGYTVTASTQAKVAIHLNAGQGVNWGFYHIKFDDGTHIQFQTTPGQLTGLSFGDRCYNFKGKLYCFDQQNNLYCQMRFQDTGGFFSKKKLQFDDEVQGQLVKVHDGFISKFIQSDKRLSPTKKQILKQISVISGRWTDGIKFDEQIYYDVLNQLPQQLMDEPYPLNSNSNYRQDLQYRRKDDLVRSQMQKQRLQIIQRGDRKFRQKYHGPAH